MKHPSASRHHRRTARLRPLMIALCSAGCVSATLAQITSTTLPTGYNTVAGTSTASIKGTEAAPVLEFVQTTNRAVVEFSTFSIGQNATVRNTALNPVDGSAWTNSLTLFRVSGPRTYIDGTFEANNRVVLVNPSGIQLGSTARVDVGNIIMSSLDLDPTQTANNYEGFMSGDPHIVFNTGSGYGGYGGYGSYGNAIVDVDQGAQLTAADGGSILLIGNQGVRNQGAIKLRNGGEVSLVAAGRVDVDVGDSGYIKLTDFAQGNNATTRVVYNTGSIDAPNGTVNLAAAGNGNGFNVFSDGVPVVPQAGQASRSSGVFNFGEITARGSNGGEGTVRLLAKGVNSMAYTQGLIDVSALDGLSRAGSINLSATNIFVSGNGESPTVLRADGPNGGGSIDLGDNISLDPAEREAGTQPEWIYVSGNSTLSADATVNGNGGTIRLATLHDNTGDNSEPFARTDFGVIELYGTTQARGGVSGGNGGTVYTHAPVVSTRFNGQSASINVFARAAGALGGSWNLYSPRITIGNDSLFDESSFYQPNWPETYVNAQEVASVLNGGGSVTMSTIHANAQVAGGDLTIEFGTDVIKTTGGASELTLSSSGNLIMEAGTGIVSRSGGLKVTLQADGDGDGNGSLILDGQRFIPTQRDTPAGTRLQPQAVGEDGSAPVVIQTNGADLTLNGAVQVSEGSGPITETAGVYINGSELDTRSLTDTTVRGNITITGSGGGTVAPSENLPSGLASQNGVTIGGDTDIIGRNIAITGTSTSATGVRLSDTAISTDRGAINITGLSQGGGAVGRPIGVDIGENVVLNVGQGRAAILGRAVGGVLNATLSNAVGLRIEDLTLTTTGGVSDPRQTITLAGQSVGSSSPGIQVTGESPGIRLHDQAGEGLASTADVIVGGSADFTPGQPSANQALDLGAPRWNTTGRVNVRPLGVSASGDLTEALGTLINVGNSVSRPDTNFIVRPEWFNPTVNGDLAVNGVVIGSSGHTGAILVDDGALNGAGTVSLQNQGEGAAGIQLGQQGTVIQTLNLLSAGNITQTGAIAVGNLRLIYGPQSSVQLNNAGNRIGTLSYSGLAAPGISAQAVPAASASSGILGYDTGGQVFQALAITTGGQGQTERPNTTTPTSVSEEAIPRPFEGPDALSELRTDVYLHGQLSRPQLCTAANTTGAGQGIESDFEPLALEWMKVRRGAQLSNCSGVRADSSCSAF